MKIKVSGGIITIENNMISSDGLKEEIIGTNVEENNAIEVSNSAIDGVESLILALHCAGYDVSDPKFIQAVEVSLDAIGNNS